MTVETVRRVHAFLTGLVGVTLMTEPGGAVLNLTEAVICLVIAVGELVTWYTAGSLHGAVKTRTGHFTEVTLIARLAAEDIDCPLGSSKNRVGWRGVPEENAGEDGLYKRSFHGTPVKRIVTFCFDLFNVPQNLIPERPELRKRYGTTS